MLIRCLLMTAFLAVSAIATNAPKGIARLKKMQKGRRVWDSPEMKPYNTRTKKKEKKKKKTHIFFAAKEKPYIFAQMR